MKLNLVIPAAGLGSRFRATGNATPKPLIDISGLPMIAWVVGNFELNSEDEIWVISQKHDALPSRLNESFSKLVNKVHFIEIEGLTDGAATTLQKVLDQIPPHEPVICANSDQYVSADLEEFVDSIRGSHADGQILTMAAEGNKWSYIERDQSNEIIRVVEKIEVSNEATVGIYGWKSVAVASDSIAKMKSDEFKVNGEYYVAPSYTYIVNGGGRISTTNIGNIENDVHGLGTPEDLAIFLTNSNFDEYRSRVVSNLRLEK
jgi:NDP-sugar pyrophosphorylase family protein